MSYCVQCGNEIILDAKYCQNCGKPLVSSTEHATPVTKSKLGWHKHLYDATQWTTLAFVALLAAVGLALVISNAIAFAAGKPTTGEGTGNLWWFITFTYFFNRLPWDKLPWKRSDFVQRHGVLSGLFIAFLINAGVYALAMLSLRHAA